jgi:hypothetical protein
MSTNNFGTEDVVKSLIQMGLKMRLPRKFSFWRTY